VSLFALQFAKAAGAKPFVISSSDEKLEKARTVIDRAFEFTEAREALRHLESGGHFGKIIIKF
jgi:NADPH:quinone reductase-like Zn-dependent oxidoreductase